MKVVRSFALLLCLIALSAAVYAAPLSPYKLTEEEKARLDKWEQDVNQQADDLIREKRWEFYYIGYERSEGTPGVSCDASPKRVQPPPLDVIARPARARVDAAAGRFNARIASAMREAGDDSCPLEDALVIGNDVRRQTLAATPAVCAKGPQSNISAAAQGGCASEVKRLISDGAKVNWRDASNLDGLSWAIIRGDVNIVGMMLSAGLSPNQRPRERDIPPLALAAQFKRFEVAKELLRRGAEVNAEWRNFGPSNALDYAAQSGDLATMRLLVDAGAPVEAQGADSQGPLVWAAWSGNVAAVQYLLGKGADPKRRIFEPLLPAYHSALHGAVGAGSADVVKVLLKAGVDPNRETDDFWGSPLHFASWWKSNYQVVKTLVDASAKVDAVDRLKRTPLNSVLNTWQWQSDQTRIVKLFMSKGADPNRLDNHGVSPLMLAAVKCPPTRELIQTLLDAGADKSVRDPQGRTALDRFKAKKDCPADSRATDPELLAVEKLLTTR